MSLPVFFSFSLFYLPIYVYCGLMVIIRWTVKYFVITDMGFHRQKHLFFLPEFKLIVHYYFSMMGQPKRDHARDHRVFSVHSVSFQNWMRCTFWRSKTKKQKKNWFFSCCLLLLYFLLVCFHLFCIYIIYTFYKNQHLMSINRTCDVSGRLWI